MFILTKLFILTWNFLVVEFDQESTPLGVLIEISSLLFSWVKNPLPSEDLVSHAVTSIGRILNMQT